MATGDQPLRHIGGRADQFRYRRLVRDAARADHQHAAVGTREMAADRIAQQTRAAQRRHRRRDRVDEYRDHRIAIESAGEHFECLRTAVVDLHPVRQRDIDVGGQHAFRQPVREIARHRQRAGQALEITDRVGACADAERRHHVVEESVEMIGGENDDQVGPETLDTFARGPADALDFGNHVGRRIDVTV